MPTTHEANDLTELERWLRQTPGGLLHPYMRIVKTSERGVHWELDGFIAADTVLVIVPHSLTLSYLNALVDDEYPVFKTRRKDFTVEAIGFFYLALQYIQREKSFWKPYLDTLPHPDGEFTTPLWFDDPIDEAWLVGTDVMHTMNQRKESYRKYYASGIAILDQAGIDTSQITWDLFRWAITMFTSRSFSSRSLAPQESKYWTSYKCGPDGRRQTVLLDMSHTPSEDLDFSVLYPVMDAGNHDMNAKMQWMFNPGRFILMNTISIKSGQEVCNNYGAKSNDELFMGYGFCISGNPRDVVLLTLKAPSAPLQELLKGSHPGFFDQQGEWSSDKATFRLPQLDSAATIFQTLPESLVELLAIMTRFDRGLTSEQPPDFQEYRLGRDGYGDRYLPHIARMLSQSLLPRLAKLTSTPLEFDATRAKHVQAKIYRESQIDIMQSYLSGLQAFTASLVPATTHSAYNLPCLMTLEDAIRCFKANSSSMMDDFLAGIEANAHTSNIEQLRLAGWEQDVWVLLICFVWLWAQENHGEGQVWEWVEELKQEYLLERLDAFDARESLEQADDLMELVKTAAQTLPNTLWSISRWTTTLIAGVGGRVIKHESFEILQLTEDGQHEQRMSLYMHALRPR